MPDTVTSAPDEPPTQPAKAKRAVVIPAKNTHCRTAREQLFFVIATGAWQFARAGINSESTQTERLASRCAASPIHR